jgi:nitroreductase
MHATLDTRVLKKAVALACRAPSVHNSQPWLWVAEGEGLRLFVDRDRTVPGTDDSGRDAIISCGAVLDHLRVAMLSAGWHANIKRFPNPKDPDHLAWIEFSSVEHVTDAQRDCATAILQRRTDRLPLGPPIHWDIFEPALRCAIDDSLVTLHVLPEDLRPQLVKAALLAETARRDDWLYHSELDWWTSSFVVNEGLPPSALASDREDARVDVGRWFPVRSHTNRRPEVKVDGSKILVLSTAGDTNADALRCGEALSTVLLECTAAGMATCTLTHLIEVNEGRDIVRGLIEQSGEPQVLIRVGIAPSMEGPPAPTPRNPLRDVLQIH